MYVYIYIYIYIFNTLTTYFSCKTPMYSGSSSFISFAQSLRVI